MSTAPVVVEEQAVADFVEMPAATVPAPTVIDAAPTVMYMQPQPVQYLAADGQPVQYVMEQPVQYVTADGQPLSYVDPGAVYEYAAPAVQYLQQPAVFNISPETFAKLAQGG